MLLKSFAALALLALVAVAKSQPTPTASAESDPAFYERLAKAEAKRAHRPVTLKSAEYVYIYFPWVVYAEAFDKLALTERSTSSPGAASNNGVLDVAWAGMMQAGIRSPANSVASANWTYGAAGIMLLDFLAASAKEDGQRRAFSLGQESLQVPSLHFLAPLPGAFDDKTGLTAANAVDKVLTTMGLGCAPALKFAPDESREFVGEYSPGHHYSRLYACGVRDGETIAKTRPLPQMWIGAYSDAPTTMRFSFSKLSTYPHFNALLNLAPGDRSIARVAYEHVRDRIPSDWTTVFTAPDEQGRWKVFVARGGQVMAFDPPPPPAAVSR